MEARVQARAAQLEKEYKAEADRRYMELRANFDTLQAQFDSLR
jgi:hypothetical protein